MLGVLMLDKRVIWTGKKPVVQRLEFKGSVLKPVQIIEEVLLDLTSDDSVDAIIQGKL
jgi:hypothetical protein